MPIEENQQVTHRQHAVPQNIMDVEFKLIGDLTMRQFFYLVIFGGLAYGTFTLVQSPVKWVGIFIFIMIGLALAFVPLQERSLDEWINNFFKAMYTPTQRIWKKETVLPAAFAYQNIQNIHQELITLAPTTSRRKLENYLQHYKEEVAVDKYDYDEASYIKKVREAYANQPKAPVKTAVATVEPVQTPPSKPPTVKPQEPKAEEPKQQPPKVEKPKVQEPKTTETKTKEKAPEPVKIPKPESVTTSTKEKEETKKEKHSLLGGLFGKNEKQQKEKDIEAIKLPQPEKTEKKQEEPVETKDVQEPSLQKTPEETQKTEPKIVETQQYAAEKLEEEIEEKIKPEIVERTMEIVEEAETPTLKQIPVQESVTTQKEAITTPLDAYTLPKEETLVLPGEADSSEPLLPLTPDQLPGRKFTKLIPDQGEIILPIRGEKVLKTEEYEKSEAKIEKELEQKTKQLQDLLDQIKADSEIAPKLKEEKPVQKAPEPKLEPKNETKTEPNAEPSEQMPTTKIETPSKPQQISKEKLEKEPEEHTSESKPASTPVSSSEFKPEPTTVATPEPEPAPKPPQIDEEERARRIAQEDAIQRMISENSKLNEEINRLKTEMAKATNLQKDLQQQSTVIQMAETEQEKLKTQIAELSKRLEEKETAPPVQPQKESQAPAKPVGPQVVEPTFAKMQSITDKPNIVTGVIRNQHGEPLQGVVVIIKKSNGDPVRAIKTNVLGQFAITTPITNGNYTIEIDKSNKTGLIFDIIKLKTVGEVVPPLEFIGREQ